MEIQKKNVKVNLNLVRNLRLGGVAILLVGLLFKVWILWGIGLFIWMGTHFYTLGKMEEILFEEPKENENEE